MNAHYTNVIAYNNISRMELKFRALSTGEEKEDISTEIQAMGTGDKTQMLNLLSKLVAIKYYRQTGCLNNVEDPKAQNQLWQQIQTQGLLPGRFKLTDLMAFIKNDSYIFQKKIPSTFKALLLSLNNEQKQKLIDKFDADLSKNISDFLTNATGGTWPEATSVTTSERTRHTAVVAPKQSLTDDEARGIVKKILLVYPDRKGGERIDGRAFNRQGLLVEVFGKKSIYSAKSQIKVKDLLANYVKKTKNANPNIVAHYALATLFRRDQLIPDPL